jgi:molybdopterin-guanine dinucleotide biosynthesis protein B
MNGMSTPVVSIVGKSNSGKTTLLVKIVQRLTRKGYRIGTIKHDAHSFEMDYPGKDSYRHFHSGSNATLILSPEKLAFIKRLTKPMPLNTVIKRFFYDVDLLITEGFKKEDKPKIEIVRSKISQAPLCAPKGNNLIALVTNISIKGYPQPQFKLNDVKRITEFIERRFL